MPTQSEYLARDMNKYSQDYSCASTITLISRLKEIVVFALCRLERDYRERGSLNRSTHLESSERSRWHVLHYHSTKAYLCDIWVIMTRTSIALMGTYIWARFSLIQCDRCPILCRGTSSSIARGNSQPLQSTSVEWSRMPLQVKSRALYEFVFIIVKHKWGYSLFILKLCSDFHCSRCVVNVRMHFIINLNCVFSSTFSKFWHVASLTLTMYSIIQWIVFSAAPFRNFTWCTLTRS